MLQSHLEHSTKRYLLSFWGEHSQDVIAKASGYLACAGPSATYNWRCLWWTDVPNTGSPGWSIRCNTVLLQLRRGKQEAPHALKALWQVLLDGVRVLRLTQDIQQLIIGKKVEPEQVQGDSTWSLASRLIFARVSAI